MWWQHHSSELSRMFLEPILDNSGPMTWCIVPLEYPIIVQVHEGLQIVTKQSSVVVTGQ
jgi:hypothetical protein